MFWQYSIAAAIAVGLIKLGALSVWVAVLKAMLSIVLALAVGLNVGLLFVWRRYKNDRQGE